MDPAPCALCGLPASCPHPAQIGGSDLTFCCTGCRQVYQILIESQAWDGQADPTRTDLYQQCLAMGLIARPHADIPSPPAAIPSASTGAAFQETREAALHIGGMSCASCAWLIEHAVGRAKGVTTCRVLFASDLAKITYQPARTTPEALRETIQRLGYTATPYEAGGPASESAKARRAGLIRAGIAMAFAMNAMMFSFALYLGYGGGLGRAGGLLLVWGSLLASLPVVAAGWPIFVKAVQAARHGAATLETLITVGSLAAFGVSLQAMARGDVRHIYFDTADMLIGLVLVGKHLESGVKGHAAGAVALLHDLLPKKATRLTPEGGERLVAQSQLRPGDRVLVRPGERIPADGRVLAGAARVEESLLTGEARPVLKEIGDSVTGGTLASDAPLTVEVTQVGSDSAVARMIALVEDALAGKSRAERWADAVARRFVPAILLLALTTGWVLAGLFHVPAPEAALRAISTLVIACPCALSLATPLAVSASVGAMARRGILIANAAALETLPQVRHVFLDKTGTLTEGRFLVRGFQGDPADRAALAALETPSEHPLARALTAEWPTDGLTVAEFARHEGQGVTGIIGGQRWFLGNRLLAERKEAVVSPSAAEQAEQWTQQGWTVLYYGAAGRLRGLIALGDAPRPGAREALVRLRAMGLTLGVVSGDAAGTVSALASSLGLTESRGGLTPAEKVAQVRERQAAAPPPVALVGDGINDAPALAQADVGIAFGSGTEIARRAADILLVGDDLNRLADLFLMARRTAAVIRQNLLWACVYNAVCLPLTLLTPWISPPLAALAMLVSSLTVVFNSKRLER